MNYPKDLSGMTFGNWEVLCYDFTNERGISYFKCKCSCGVEKSIARNNLISGDSTSCGHDSSKDKLVDMTGQQFGELTVLKYIKDEKKWLCQCSCGNTVLKRSWDLRNNKGKTCGIKENHTSKKMIDLTGKTFGELTVIKYAGDRNWICRCSCGNTIETQGARLRDGSKTSCGHTLNQVKRIDLTGKTFGDLYVNKYLNYKKYRCTCKCGNTRDVLASELSGGKVTQCEQCTLTRLNKQYADSRIDLTGQVFGDLTVIGYKQDIHKWTCRCSCGKELDVYGQHLRIGDTKSCGCKYGLSTEYRSYLEMEIAKYISDNYTGQVINNTRGILDNNRELDIYLPEINVAFEVNGDYWHNDEHANYEYHKAKVLECKNKGIRLINIYEYEWLYNNKNIKQLIINAISVKNIIYARDTELCDISDDEAKMFLEQYHYQGYAKALINLGLKYKNRLVALMTFGRPRFNNDVDFEIIRLAFSNDIGIVGGAEKLFKAFLNKTNKPSILSYCNIDKFSGTVYEKLGMTLDGYSKPGYVWVNHKTNSVLQRYQTQKDKLIKLGLGDASETEDEIMKRNRYMKVYNSGNARYIYDNK